MSDVREVAILNPASSWIGTSIKLGQHFMFVTVPTGVGMPIDWQGKKVVIKSLHEQVMWRGLIRVGANSPESLSSFKNFRAMSTDLDLHQPGDPVYVNLYWWKMAGQSVRLVLKKNGQDHPIVREVRLNHVGGGQLILNGLDAAEYEVYYESDPSYNVSFKVAPFGMTGLMMSVLEYQSSDDGGQDKLTVKLQLRTFGNAPFTQPVNLGLRAGTKTIDESRLPVAPDSEGVVFYSFDVDDTDGAISVYAAGAIDADMTAQAAIRGAAAQNREVKTLSRLVPSVNMSRTPRDGYNSHRGVYLGSGVVVGGNDPLVRIGGVVSETVQYMVIAPMELAVIRVIDEDGIHIHEFKADQLTQGAMIEVPYAGMACDVALAGFISTRGGTEYQPWESEDAAMRPNALTAEIVAPERVKPGRQTLVQVRTNGCRGKVFLLLNVTDMRLMTSTAPEDGMADGLYGSFVRSGERPGLKDAGALFDAYMQSQRSVRVSAARDGSLRGEGYRSVTRGHHTEPPATLGGFLGDDDDILESMSDGGLETIGVKGFSLAPLQTAMAESAAQTAVVTETRPRVELVAPSMEPLQNTVLCGWYEADADGTLLVQVPTEGIVRLRLEAFVADEYGQFAQTQTEMVVTEDVVAKLYPPAFLAPGFPALIKGSVATTTGRAIVYVNVNGQGVPFQINRTTYQSGDVVHSLGEIAFFAKAGDSVILNVSECDEAGERTLLPSEATATIINTLGAMKHTFWQSQIVRRGMKVSIDDVGAKQLYVGVGSASVLGALVENIIAISGCDCCEQTINKLPAMLYAFVNLEGNDRQAVKDQIVALYDRMISMEKPGGGFYFYPPSRYTGSNLHYEELAIRRAVWIKHVMDNPVLREDADIMRMLDRLYKIGMQGMCSYRLSTEGQMTNPGSAYDVLMEHPERPDEAWNLVSSLVTSKDEEYAVSGTYGSVDMQTQMAYAVAVAINTGHFDEATDWWNWLVSQFTGNVPYSTQIAGPLAIAGLAMHESGMVAPATRVKVTTAEREFELLLTELIELQNQNVEILAVEAVDGTVVVRYETTKFETWDTLNFVYPMQVELTNSQGEPLTGIRVGNRVIMRVVLTSGYQAGQQLRMCLPYGLVQEEGGGNIVQIVQDFAGQSVLEFELRAVTPSIVSFSGPAISRTGSCHVRDMADETKAGSANLALVINP